MRTDWTDKRLDDLKQSVDGGFKEVKGSIDPVDGRVDSLHGRVDGLQRTMVLGFLSLGGLTLGCFGALVTFFGGH
jgi:hypothetical protein